MGGPWGASPPGAPKTLSILPYIHKITNRSTGVLTKFGKYRAVWGVPVLGPGPVLGPWAREKLTLGSVENRQRSARCLRISLQGVKKIDIDLPQMHFVPVRSFEASCWNEMHLGEVKLGKSDLL